MIDLNQQSGNQEKTLAFLLNGIMDVPPVLDCKLTGMSQDSREIAPGALFVALKGIQQHGLAFASQAEKQGAAAIVWESDDGVNAPDVDIPSIEISGLRDCLGLIAERFYGFPTSHMNVIGVTGTDGKTSVSHFIAQALDNCAVMGTIGIGEPGKLQKASHTTPDVISVHKNLAEMKRQGFNTIAMEVSSHALDQGRVDNIAFDVAVLTNLSRDHLDYHGTLKAYADAKKKLFDWSDLKTRVLNLDDEFGRLLADKYPEGMIGYGIGEPDAYPQNTLAARKAVFSNEGMSAELVYGEQRAQLKASILGRFNLSNLLAAVGAMLGLGFSLNDAVNAVNRVHIVDGRMEKVSDKASGVLVVVDYAHTPNALQTVLKALREHVGESASLVCVFGCGGDRDAGKRPLMAQAVENNADVVIVTDDNPRSEDPQKIMRDIMAGFAQPENITVEHDRAKAIRIALRQAKQGDVVLIAGKGHEQGQILATGVAPFSDKEEANRVLQELAA